MSKAANHSAAPSIVAEGLGHSYGEGAVRTTVLQQLSLQFWPGELALVMGASGSGKSTLLATLSGLLRPQFGTVTSLGTSIWSLKPRELERFRFQHCAFVFQNFNLFPALNAMQQVEQVLKYQKVKKPEAHRRAVEVLGSVGLDHRLKQKPSEMSGGEKQRVAIARALSKMPQLIFADEPTSALDSVSGQVVIKLLHQAAKERGAAVVVVTHDPRLEAYADRVIHMEDGKILSDTMISEPPVIA